jgi:hypothetical protein
MSRGALLDAEPCHCGTHSTVVTRRQYETLASKIQIFSLEIPQHSHDNSKKRSSATLWCRWNSRLSANDAPSGDVPNRWNRPGLSVIAVREMTFAAFSSAAPRRQ